MKSGRRRGRARARVASRVPGRRGSGIGLRLVAGARSGRRPAPEAQVRRASASRGSRRKKRQLGLQVALARGSASRPGLSSKGPARSPGCGEPISAPSGRRVAAFAVGRTVSLRSAARQRPAALVARRRSPTSIMDCWCKGRPEGVRNTIERPPNRHDTSRREIPRTPGAT